MADDGTSPATGNATSSDAAVAEAEAAVEPETQPTAPEVASAAAADQDVRNVAGDVIQQVCVY